MTDPSASRDRDDDGTLFDGQHTGAPVPLGQATGEVAARIDTRTNTGSRRGGQRVGRRDQQRRGGVEIASLSVSVPAALADAWKRTARATRRTQVDVVLDATVRYRETLPSVVASYITVRNAGEETVLSDGLFVRTSRSGAQAARTAGGAAASGAASGAAGGAAGGEEASQGPADPLLNGPFVAMSLRMAASNVSVLDRLTHEARAESRSQLVAAILRQYINDEAARADDDGHQQVLTAAGSGAGSPRL